MHLSSPNVSLITVPPRSMVFPDHVRARWYYETGQVSNLSLVRHLVDDVLVDGRVLVDVGSFVGSLAVGCGQSDKVSAVHAFEPNPRCFSCLVANVGFSGLQDKVQCYKQSLGSAAGEASWYMRSDDGFLNGTALLTPGKCEYLRAWSSVPVRSLDSYELSNVGCLVVDVNGSELEVLKGAERTIMRDRPVLVVTSWGLYKRPHVPEVKAMREQLFAYMAGPLNYEEPVAFSALPDVFIAKPN